MFTIQEKFESLTQRWRLHRINSRRRPEVLRKWYTWESVRSKNVQAHYVAPKADAQEILRIVQGCDETMQQIAALLNVTLSRRPVPVFLYPDDHAFRRCEQIQGWPLFGAIMRNGSISLPYGTWRTIAKPITHELTHVVVWRHCGKPAVLLLDEGLAECVENRLYPEAKKVLSPYLDLPLQNLANPQRFGSCLTNHALSDDAYAHAHSFVEYLIDGYGIDSFLRLLKASSGRRWQESEKRFAVAIHRTYGLTVQDLERQWRQDSATPSPYLRGV